MIGSSAMTSRRTVLKGNRWRQRMAGGGPV